MRYKDISKLFTNNMKMSRQKNQKFKSLIVHIPTYVVLCRYLKKLTKNIFSTRNTLQIEPI